MLNRIRRSLQIRFRLATSTKYELPLFSVADRAFVYYPLRSEIGKALFRGQFENAELEFVRKNLSAGDCFIDIGANAGIFSIVAAQVVGTEGAVLAFEPSAREAALCRFNVRANGITNVIINEAAVSDVDGRAELMVSEDGAMNSFRKTMHPNQRLQGSLHVKTVRLDSVLASVGNRNVALIKIDAEGAERSIILPAMSALKGICGIQVLFESQNVNNQAFGYTASKFLKELCDAGGRVRQLTPQGQLSEVKMDDPLIGDQTYNFVLSF